MPGAGEANDIEDQLVAALQELESGGEAALQRLLTACAPARAAELRARLEVLRGAGLLAPPDAAATAAPPREPHDLTGARFGEFVVVHKLAAGGMGVVYVAEQTSLQRRVALKVVRPELVLSDVAHERFHREIEAVARLQHPGIVPILAVGRDRGLPWFAMEYVDGASLDTVIATARRLDPARRSAALLQRALGTSERCTGTPGNELFTGTWPTACARIALQIARAMSYVHERGIVHRDLKPSNIVLTRHGQALVLDFGLAHVHDMQQLTRTNTALGSPAYMAPEQVLGEAVDERVDVYGLGVTLYELLAAQLPFVAASEERLRQMVVEGAARPLRQLNRAVPRELAIVCAVAMDKERARRYGSMAEFADDLERVLAGQPIRARPLPVVVRFVRLCQRHVGATVAAAAILLLLLQFPFALWWLEARTNEQLVVANRRLESARRAEAQANSELAAANAALREEREVAASSFEDAYVAIHAMLDRTGRFELATTPGSEGLRVEILDRAVHLYERLMRRRPDDVRVAIDAARSRQRLGALRAEMGDFAGGEAEYATVLEQLAEVGGADAAAVRGCTLKLLGQSLADRGAYAAAEPVLLRGLCEMDAALAAGAHVLNRLHRAEVLNSLALVAAGLGRAAERGDRLREAQREKRQLLLERPGDVAAVSAFALGCHNLGRCLADEGDRAGARALVDEGIAALCAIRPEPEDELVHRNRLANLFSLRGVLHNEAGEQSLAEADYGVALALRLESYEQFPNTATHAAKVGATLHNLAMVHFAKRDAERALAADEAAVHHLELAVRMAPANRTHRLHLEYALVGRCSALASLRQNDALEAAVAELASRAVTNEGLLNAARLYVHVGRVAHKRGGEGAAAKVAAARSAAADLVAKAVENGFCDVAHFAEGRFAGMYAELRGVPAYDAALQSL